VIIHWPQVIVVTVTCYALILLYLPFNPVYSTVFLFAIVAYWSRLPGVGIPSPFFILYFADLVDLFSLIIAINIGGFEGALFSAFGNFGSRMAGIFPKWWSVIRDGSFQFIICLFIPYIHAITGDIYISMMIYTIIRRLLFIPIWIIYPDIPLGNFCVIWLGATTGSLAINAFYSKHFGPFFDSLLEQGVSFNWTLFIIVTFSIILGKMLLFGRSGGSYLDQRRLLRFIVRKIEGEKQPKKRKEIVSDEELVISVSRELKQK